MSNYQYHAFLSFAVEDKIEVATELYHQLERTGLKVWYSGRELTYGESIQDSIRKGLNKSRYAVLIITNHYFKTNYAQQELGALWSREEEGKQIIIPVFHKITPEEVGFENPALADRWALNTNIGLENVAKAIHQHITQADKRDNSNKDKGKGKSWWFLLFLFLALVMASIYWFSKETSLQDSFIVRTIEQRIADFQNNLEAERLDILDAQGTQLTDKKAVITFLDEFNSIDAQFRNYYEFTNGFDDIEFEKNVSPAAGVNFELWSAQDNYGFSYPIIHRVDGEGANIDTKFFYFNTQPVGYEIADITDQDSVVLVSVKYFEHIRFVTFHYEYGKQTSQRKHTTYSVHALKPVEEYVFTIEDEGWQFTTVR